MAICSISLAARTLWASASDGQFEYQINVEHELAKKLDETLDPILGAGNYRTGVSVECDFSGVEESEEVLDPTKSIIVSSQRTDESTAEAAWHAGIPGTCRQSSRSPSRRPGRRQRHHAPHRELRIIRPAEQCAMWSIRAER